MINYITFNDEIMPGKRVSSLENIEIKKGMKGFIYKDRVILFGQRISLYDLKIDLIKLLKYLNFDDMLLVEKGMLEGNIMIKNLKTQMNLKKVLKKYLKNRNWKYKYTYTSDTNNFLHLAVMTPMGDMVDVRILENVDNYELRYAPMTREGKNAFSLGVFQVEYINK